jgi:hypothetical protein
MELYTFIQWIDSTKYAFAIDVSFLKQYFNWSFVRHALDNFKMY